MGHLATHKTYTTISEVNWGHNLSLLTDRSQGSCETVTGIVMVSWQLAKGFDTSLEFVKDSSCSFGDDSQWPKVLSGNFLSLSLPFESAPGGMDLELAEHVAR